MAQGQSNEFLVWQDGAPVVNANADSEFDVWQDGVPAEDRDEGFTTGGGGAVRRRVVDF